MVAEAAGADRSVAGVVGNSMKRLLLIASSTIMLFFAVVLGAPVDIQLKNGTSLKVETGQTVTVEWEDRGTNKVTEGEITNATDDYIVVNGEFIFIEWIISLNGENDTQDSQPDVTSGDSTEDSTDNNSSIPIRSIQAKVSEGELPRGVFVLPYHQMVGTYFRPTELRQLVEHIDTNYGSGQIIVLEINSGGGAVSKWSEIRDVLFDAKERHRIVAWIEQAGSGAAASAFLCDEIYYRSYGYLGSITMYSGDIENVADDQTLYAWIKELQGVLAKSSWNPLVAGSMVKNVEAFSYNIDPVTGEITYFDDMSGSNVLSRHDQNNMLSAPEALKCGLSDGTADTGEQLAKHLDLDDWVEIDQFGREIATAWWKTLDEWEEINQELSRQAQGDVEGDTQKQRISNQIKALEELIRWEKRLGETAAMASRGMLSEQGLIRLRGAILRLKQQRQFIDD